MRIPRSQTRISIESDRSTHMRPHVFLDLFRTASSQTLTRAGAAAAVAWVPVAVLSAIRGGSSFRSFLTDYASLSRFLIIIPVLILAEPPLRARLTLVVKHFEMFLIPQEQQTRLRQEWESCQRLQDSKVAQGILVLLTYATAAWLGQYLSPGGPEFMEWWKGAGGFRFFSPAGTWALFVSYPIVIFLAFLWLWRQLLWIQLLRSTTRLNLRLIAAHSDNLGGLSFIEASLRGQLLFSFCMGVGLAGAIANRILHDGQKLVAFRHLPLILVAAVLIVCVSPYFLFTSTLVQMRRRGMLWYGAFARAVGEQFEKKWLHRADSLDEDVLSVFRFFDDDGSLCCGCQHQ